MTAFNSLIDRWNIHFGDTDRKGTLTVGRHLAASLEKSMESIGLQDREMELIKKFDYYQRALGLIRSQMCRVLSYRRSQCKAAARMYNSMERGEHLKRQEVGRWLMESIEQLDEAVRSFWNCLVGRARRLEDDDVDVTSDASLSATNDETDDDDTA